MSDNKKISDKGIPVIPERKRSPLVKVGIALIWIVCGMIFLGVAAACIATWYLTPGRLSKIIREEASEYLHADVIAEHPTFTIWSTFPDLHFKIDSLEIKSRAVTRVTKEEKEAMDEMHAAPSRLVTSGPLEGDINILSLIRGDIAIGGVSASGLNVNLVEVSDSVSNFNILKNKVKDTEMPEFSIGEICLTSPSHISFANVAADLRSDIAVSDVSLMHSAVARHSYKAAIAGNASVMSGGKPDLKDFPFSIAGDINLDFNPLVLTISQTDVRLGNIKSIVDAQIASGEKLAINSLEIRTEDFSADSLINYLPIKKIPFPETIDTDVRLSMNAKLTEPYVLPANSEANTLPSLEALLTVEEGDMVITGSNGRRSVIRHGDILGNLIIDGRHPELSHIDVPEFRVDGDATEMKLKAYISDIFEDPEIRVAAVGNTDLKLAGNVIKPLRQYKPSGSMTADASVSFRVSNMQRADMENVRLRGDVALSDYAVTIPMQKMKANGNKLSLNFGTKARELSSDWVRDGVLDVTMLSDTLHISGNGMKTDVNGLKLKGKVARKSISAPQKFDILLTGESVSTAAGPRKFMAEGISAEFRALKLKDKVVSKPFVIPAVWTADRRSMEFVGHTPEYVSYTLPKNMIDLLSQWKTHLVLKVRTGEILTPELPLHNGFGDLSMEASIDSVKLDNLDFNSQDTRLHVKGGISNLRQFLTSGKVAPLRVALDVAIDTVQINQLAGAYNHGIQYTHGPKASVLTVIPDTLTPSDTLSLLIPRNIIADIKASAMMTKYTDLEMHDLVANLKIKDGRLDITDLGIVTDFGALKMGFGFDTSDIQRISMNMRMGLAEVNLVNFFSNFHTLLLMMPQMRNIKGDLSALAEAKLLLFPNMYFNMPSIWADLYVHGEHLSLHQDPFIRKITRMMLIHDNGDIKLSDMDIHASVHDNLMELYPFQISFNNYKLQFGGLNNFDGDMYYHLGIDKSPVPFPFGINIKGDFRHPEIRFGGAAYKVDQGEEISSTVMEEKKINLPLELKCLIREIIEKAAEADTTPASFYTY